MKPSQEYVERCAGETGFQPATLEKVIRLGELAAEINRHPLLSEALVLKGGTPLNLCFGEPRRLSVDLDLNYVGASDRDTMRERRPDVEAALGELARRLGYAVQWSADAFAGRKLYLRYRSAGGGDDRIEVDVNYLFRAPIGEPQMMDMWQPGELDCPRVRVVSTDEVCIGKLLALLDRAAPRDAWDVIRLPSIAPRELESPVFRLRLLCLSITLDRPLPDYDRRRIQRQLTEAVVRERLWPMLAGDETPGAERLVQDAWDVIARYVSLQPHEQAFIAEAGRGEFRGDLLALDQGDEVARLRDHPAVQWKLKNAREWRGA